MTDKIIIDHNHPAYQAKWRMAGKNRWNGAYYYSKEIVRNIISRVQTDRNWITVNLPGIGANHAVVFIHNNLHPEHYKWLERFDDLVLVCGVPETCEKVEHLGRTIYLPLSIDVEEVKAYKVPKAERSGSAFVGRPAKLRMKKIDFPEGTEIIQGVRREVMLQRMAKKEEVYAVGRTAIEAKALGCRLKAYDPRFPKVSFWKVVDNRDAAKLLQAELDRIDGEKNE